MQGFDTVISTEDELRKITGHAGELAAGKVIDHIDSHVQHFIAKSPFMLMSSRGSDGREDISPKGDPAGFVKVLDQNTLAIPDRPGNRRMDTFSNLLKDDQIGLIFLIPGHADTLRISGRAKIVQDAALGAELAIKGRAPELILIVSVEEASMHCPKCMIRSHIWQPDSWPEMQDFPSLASIVKDHAKADSHALEDLEAHLETSNRERLY